MVSRWLDILAGRERRRLQVHVQETYPKVLVSTGLCALLR